MKNRASRKMKNLSSEVLLFILHSSFFILHLFSAMFSCRRLFSSISFMFSLAFET